MNWRGRKSSLLNHIAGWLFVIVVNVIILYSYSARTTSPENVNYWEIFTSRTFEWAIYIIAFYVSYLLLIPGLLFRGRSVLFVLSTVVLLAVSFCTVKHHNNTLLEQRIMAIEESLREHEPPVGDGRALSPGPPQPTPYYKDKYWIRSRMSYNPASRNNVPIVYGLLVVITASIAVRFIKKWRTDEKVQSENEKVRIATELAYLKQQINPHFLFNTLNSLYSMTIDCPGPASETVLKLSSILRYMLYETDKNKVLLSDELNVVNDYLELQKLRLTDKTRLQYRVQGDPAGLHIEPMLLIPLIENAFKYGSDSVNESLVEVDISIDNDLFTFVVGNRQVHETDPENRNSGIGIKNIRRRLDLHYGKNYIFKIEGQNHFFRVTLQLRLTDR